MRHSSEEFVFSVGGVRRGGGERGERERERERRERERERERERVRERVGWGGIEGQTG